MSDTERTVRRHVERDHRDVVDGIDACADAVARSWDDRTWDGSAGRTRDGPADRIRDGSALRRRLRAELERAGLLGELPAVLAGSVAAAGFELPAKPVPAPPYVVVTSRGPLLRATLAPGRLAIRFDVFGVDRADGTCYRRLDGVDLDVTLRRVDSP